MAISLGARGGNGKRRYGGGVGTLSEINIIPLVDVVLVLLIIFMITAPVIYQSAIKVQLPKIRSGESSEKSPFQFTIGRDGALHMGSEKIPDWSELPKRIQATGAGRDLTQETAAERVGKGRASVANSLRLLALDGEIQGYIAKNLLSVGHAKVLLGVQDSPSRLVLARRIIEEGLSVRVTEKLALNAKSSGGSSSSSPRAKPGTSAKDAATVAGIEKRLGSHLGARVAILHTPKKGRIVIEYRGNEDLARLLGLLGVEA